MGLVSATTGTTTTAVDTTELAPGLRLGVLRLARRLRQQHAEGDVSASGLSALSTIERLGPLTLGEVAAHEQVQPPTMTRIVARLEELGLVARTADAADRRVQRVDVTKAGARFVAKSRTRKDAYLAARLGKLTDAERRTLAEAIPLLERLAGSDRP